MKAIVTGGAGFIGSHLVDRLLENKWEVTAVDILTGPNARNIDHLRNNHNFEYVVSDIKNKDSLLDLTNGADMIFHMAANSDIRNGGMNPDIDFENTFLTTRSVLEAMRINKIKKLFFASTSAVYGNKMNMELDEKTGDLQPISYYGASKFASESLISAYSYMNSFDSLIFRFPNVVGSRLTHGVIFDFVNKLKTNPKKLEILGNGKQSKQYVHVTDLVNGIVRFSSDMGKGMNIFNVSTESFTTVKEIADIVCRRMNLNNVEYIYSGGDCGWKGDVPSFNYNISKAKKAGWDYKYSSTQAVEKSAEELHI